MKGKTFAQDDRALTMEGFWNKMMAKYPEPMKAFCLWIDRYKARVHWDLLFNEGNGVFTPKYHELPYGFQLGIWFEYITEIGACQIDIDLIDFDLAEDIEMFLKQAAQNLVSGTQAG